jgi:hypothetical protein
MSEDEPETRQEREWDALHGLIGELLRPLGIENAFRKGDYWLLDENWGGHRHEIEIQNLNFLRPHVVQALRSLLQSYPDWEIWMRVDVPGKEREWPGMGLIVHKDGILDELQREHLPEEFRNLRYDDSRRLFDEK